jgi:hypothetical protein
MNTLIDTLGPFATWIIAGIIILLAIAIGWRDILRLSWMRIWAISSVCFSESIRRRVLLITPIAILGVMIVSQLQRPFDEQDAIRQTTKFALFTTGLVVVIVGILLASTSLPKEIENRVIFTIVTKPTTRLEIVLGKTLGFARVSATILLIMGLFTAGYLQFRAWNFNREITKRLEAGSVDQISRPTLEHYKTNGLLSAKSYAGTHDLQFYAKLPAPGDTRRFANASGDNQIIIPFDLTPDMIGSFEQGFRMAVVLSVGYEKAPNAPAPVDPATTQPADFGPTPLLSSTRPTTAAPPTEPAIAVGFLDYEETFLIANTEIRNGEPVKLPSADGSQRVLVELSAENISKLAKAANVPHTRRVYLAIIGASDSYHYFTDERPALLITGQIQADGTLKESGKPIEAAVDPITGKPALPIFRGGYSRYGQQLKGDKQNGMVAVYHFHKADNLGTDRANFEMRLGIDRGGTEGAEEEDTVTQVSLQVRNTATGQLGKEQIVKPETNRTAYFSFPKDEIAGGEFDLIVRCTTPDHSIGLRSGGLALVTDTGSFYGNLFKSLLIFWLLSVLVVAVAISCSTFLSWPIAVVLCIVILLGKWGVMQLGDATKPGIGAQVANDFGFKDSAQAKVVDKSVETLAKLLNALAAVLPDISQYPATEDIERGVSIPWFKLRGSLSESLAFGIPLLLLGYVVLKNKEVAP